MSKTLKPLLFIAAAFLLVLLLAIAFLTVPDQLREIPEPHYFASVAENSPRPTGEDFRPPANHDSPAISTPAESFPIDLDLPEPDLSHLDSETRQALEQCRDELLELCKQRMLVPSRTKDMPLDDALKELGRLTTPHFNILRKYGKMLSEHGLNVAELLAADREIYRQVHIGVLVEHEQWFDAGFEQGRNSNPYIENHSPWDTSDREWDAATYYLRRGGLKGRFTLGAISIMRRWEQLNGSDKQEGNGAIE